MSAFWSDWNEPIDDVEGRDVGLYDNISIPIAPDWKRMHVVRGLPFNGGSTALDFDSDVITAEMGGSTHNLAIYNQRAQRNTVPVNTLPNGSMPQAKVTLVSRIWIDGASNLSAAGNYVTPLVAVWSSFGAFGWCMCSISRISPFENIDGGNARLWLTVNSFNTANSYDYDCGSAAPLIGYDPGHEFKLEAEIIEPTSGAYDKMQARLSVRKLPGGGVGGMEGQWIIRNQNLLNGSGFWITEEQWMHCGFNGTGRVHARIYSLERWFGDKIWLGEPTLLDTQDDTPAVGSEDTVVAGPSDSFNPINARRNGVVIPLDSVYAKYNDGGIILGTEKNGFGNAVITLGNDGSNTPRGVELVLPDVDGAWDLDVASAVASATNSGAHIWLRESSTGKWVALGVHNNGTNRRLSVWQNAGELYRASSNFSPTAFHIAVERFSGQWYFYTYTPSFNTEGNWAVGTLFTTRADRIGFGGWAGASGATLQFNYLTKTS